MRIAQCAFTAVTVAVALRAVAPSVLAGEASEDAKPKTDLIDVVRPTRLGCVLDAWHVRPFGWVEASLSTTPDLQAGERAGRVFDVEREGFRLHQAYFGLERVPADDRCFDIGGKVGLLWGTDAALLHARGLLDDQDGEEQFDLLEAKVLARFSVAHGLTVSAGKCTTPLGFEVIEAPNNLLVSRSFLFGYAIPFTHVGVIATLEASDRWKFTYGLVEGWDVWDDVNDAWTQLAGVAWTSASKADSITLNGILGPEQADDESQLRGVLDGTWTHSFCQGRWTTALNADFGFEEGAAPDGGDARWGGVAAYLTEKVSDRFSATARVEWFRDVDGTRLGQPASLGEITFGADWKPFACLPNLRLRPEVRWDHSFDGDFFDEGRGEDQVSLTFDVLFTF